MKKNKLYIFIISVLIIIIAILAIIIIKQKNIQKNIQNTNEATQDIAYTEGIDNTISRIVEEPKTYVEISQDGTKKNKSDKMKLEKKVENLVISNISLTSDGNDTIFSADVKNINKYKQQLKLKITLLKEDGTEWITFYGIVSKTEDETTGKISTKISNSDFTNAYDLKITIE